MAALKAIWGANVTTPKEAIITKWGIDPFARGSVSYFPNGTDPDLMDEFNVPEENLLFAGGLGLGSWARGLQAEGPGQPPGRWQLAMGRHGSCTALCRATCPAHSHLILLPTAHRPPTARPPPARRPPTPQASTP
jgi:hypothetical protein